jgi:hypothetical protein
MGRREARMASIMLAEDVAMLNRELREARERIARLEAELDGRAASWIGASSKKRGASPTGKPGAGGGPRSNAR